VSDPSRISRVTLLRPAAVTHAVDMDQRSIELRVTAGANGLRVTAPRDGTLAPPGYYMLYAIDDAGVPSTAAWVRIGADVPEPADPPAPPAAPGDAPAGQPMMNPDPGTATPPPGVATAPAADLGPAQPALPTVTPGLTASDRRAPRLVVRASLQRTRRGNEVRVRVTSDERARLQARLLSPKAAPRSVRLLPGRATTVTFRLPGRARSARLGLVATDASGNAARLNRKV
jgi:hypothetical protein